MKTKDFIKMLQEEDPTGEGYIRLPGGGAPWFAESKAGYWDGSYQYLEKLNPDEKSNYKNLILVTSTEGYKIDIYSYDYDTLIWDLKGDVDEIKKRIKLKFTYLNNKEREDSTWKYIEEEAKHAREYDNNFLEIWYKEVVEQFYYDDSCEIRQPLDKPIGSYHCMKAYIEGQMPESLNQGQCDILIRSGKFYPEKKEEYYVWKHDPEKGKNWCIII